MEFAYGASLIFMWIYIQYDSTFDEITRFRPSNIAPWWFITLRATRAVRVGSWLKARTKRVQRLSGEHGGRCCVYYDYASPATYNATTPAAVNAAQHRERVCNSVSKNDGAGKGSANNNTEHHCLSQTHRAAALPKDDAKRQDSSRYQRARQPINGC